MAAPHRALASAASISSAVTGDSLKTVGVVSRRCFRLRGWVVVVTTVSAPTMLGTSDLILASAQCKSVWLETSGNMTSARKN